MAKTTWRRSAMAGAAAVALTVGAGVAPLLPTASAGVDRAAAESRIEKVGFAYDDPSSVEYQLRHASDGCTRDERSYDSEILATKVSGPAVRQVAEYDEVWRFTLTVSQAGDEVGSVLTSGYYSSYTKTVSVTVSCKRLQSLAIAGFGGPAAKYRMTLSDGEVRIGREWEPLLGSASVSRRFGQLAQARPSSIEESGSTYRVRGRVLTWSPNKKGVHAYRIQRSRMKVGYFTSCEQKDPFRWITTKKSGAFAFSTPSEPFTDVRGAGIGTFNGQGWSTKNGKVVADPDIGWGCGGA